MPVLVKRTAGGSPFLSGGAEIGLLISNAEIKVTRDGEVLIRGTIVMNGYYKDFEKQFIAN